MQAQTNAFTSYTETAYYFQTTSDIEKPLALLLDFVENLDIDQQSVEKEKESSLVNTICMNKIPNKDF